MATPRNQSVIKAFTMLKSFHHSDEWVTSSELSRRAKLPEASGYRLVQTLEDLGAITRGARGRYRPGMLLVSLSQKVIIGDLLCEASHEIIDALSRRLDMTLHIGMFEGGMVTYVTKASTPTSFVLHTRPGAQLEAYCSGLGKVLLAALPVDRLEDYLMEGELVALTPYTVTEPRRLRAQLENVRDQGYAIDDREIRAEMRCIAVPIVDGSGCSIAALSASGSIERMDSDTLEMLRGSLTSAAAAIGHRISPFEAPSHRPAVPQREVRALASSSAH
ncbi:MAG: IclR family transcriptional regulator [Janthinobacterium lividum]